MIPAVSNRHKAKGAKHKAKKIQIDGLLSVRLKPFALERTQKSIETQDSLEMP
jgi:hypothetical protein